MRIGLQLALRADARGLQIFAAGVLVSGACACAGQVEPIETTTIGGSGLGSASATDTDAETDPWSYTTGSTTDGTDASTGELTGSTGASSSSTGDCPLGASGCPCTVGGACDEGLMCTDDVCVDADPCTAAMTGSEGCQCTPGGGCDPGLECISDVCVDPS